DLSPWPQPSWLLPQPVPLTLLPDAQGQHEHPHYQGRLQWLAGPHRVEAGWWDNAQPDGACTRDYYLASSPGTGLLWVFRARHAGDTATPAWFLHGLFA
nr:DNA polymerase Y family protein [Aquabacterium sp.]